MEALDPRSPPQVAGDNKLDASKVITHSYQKSKQFALQKVLQNVGKQINQGLKDPGTTHTPLDELPPLARASHLALLALYRHASESARWGR